VFVIKPLEEMTHVELTELANLLLTQDANKQMEELFNGTNGKGFT
jgi:hypothetical protein